MNDTTRQWLRYAEVIVGKGGRGIQARGTHDDGFRITFQVEKTIRHTPNTANILIYNLNPDDERKVLQEYVEVILNAGYQSRAPKPGEDKLSPSLFGARIIFRGNIKRAFANWQDGNRIVEIQAADGDKAYHEAIVNETLAAGASPMQEVAAVMRAMQSFGITPGFIQTRSHGTVRGKVLSGAARKVLHRVADDNYAHWSFQDGVLQIVQSTAVLPSEAILVNEDTGMVGAPTISDTGVQVVCKLNPQIAINGAVLLDNNNIKIQETQLYTNGPKVKPKTLARLSPDGRYKVHTLKHVGDTRGADWNTTVETIAVGDAIPSQSHKKAAPKI